MLAFTRCHTCHQPLLPFEAGPCSGCLSELTRAPSLEALAPFQALRARFFLAGTGYRLFLEWKKCPTPRLETAFSGSPEIRREDGIWARREGDLIVPIPQSFARAWRLGRSPAASLAERLARESKLPVANLLELRDRSSRRQAELRRFQRWNRGSRWQLTHERALPRSDTRLILVDDLLTTGATLTQAAHLLQDYGYGAISAWTLGFRPSASRPESGQTWQSAAPGP